MSVHLPDERRRRLVLGALAFHGTLAGSAASAAKASAAHVAVLGAGMAGLSAALALQQAGFRVTVLEAQPHVGGRNTTLRAGDLLVDTLGEPQTCAFSPGMYLNAGPWRILPAHTRLLACARRFGIPLESVDPARPALGQQPVGGMDLLPRALAAALDVPVRTGCAVQSVRRQGSRSGVGVRIGFVCEGAHQEVDVDHALLALPLNRLQALDMDLPDAMRAALRGVESADAIKIAFETEMRSAAAVAESTHVDADLRILWPSRASTPAQNMATVYGNQAALAGPLAAPRAQQIRRAEALLRLAVEDASLRLDHPLVVQWSRVPHALAAASRLVPAAGATVRRLRAGWPPLFFAGDALSDLNGWQEGALASAEFAVQALVRHARRPR